METELLLTTQNTSGVWIRIRLVQCQKLSNFKLTLGKVGFSREKNLFKVGFQPKNEYFVDFDEYS